MEVGDVLDVFTEYIKMQDADDEVKEASQADFDNF